MMSRAKRKQGNYCSPQCCSCLTSTYRVFVNKSVCTLHKKSNSGKLGGNKVRSDLIYRALPKTRRRVTALNCTPCVHVISQQMWGLFRDRFSSEMLFWQPDALLSCRPTSKLLSIRGALAAPHHRESQSQRQTFPPITKLTVRPWVLAAAD